MRIRFITRSEELNDAMLEAYEYYVHLIGRDDDDGNTTHSGVYDKLEDNLYYYNDQYVVLRNDFAPDENDVPIPQYLDHIGYKIKKLGRQ